MLRLLLTVKETIILGKFLESLDIPEDWSCNYGIKLQEDLNFDAPMEASYSADFQYVYIKNIKAMKQVNLKDLKRGEYFTLKPIEQPTPDQVWVKGEYIRQAKKYSTHKFIDTNHETLRDGTLKVYIDFEF